MSLVTLLVVLILVGILIPLFVPMDETIKKIIYAVCAIFLVLWLFGGTHLGTIRIGG